MYANQRAIGGDFKEGTDMTSDSSIVSNCTFDSGLNLFYPADNNDFGGFEAIYLQYGTSGWDIGNNTFTRWWHASINLYSDSTTRPANYNLIHDNIMTSGGISKGKGWDLTGKASGDCRGNRIYRNLITATQTQNQVSGDSNWVYDNVFISMRDTLRKANEGVISLEAVFGGAGLAVGNKVLNNTIYNIGPNSYGIKITDNGAASDTTVKGNTVANNIVWCTDANYGFALYGTSKYIKRNTVRNNIFYKAGLTNVVSYRGTDMSVVTLNTQTTNGDVFSGNLQVDPLTVSTSDLRLQSTSLGINGGIDVGLTTDYVGTTIVGLPDIGAYENTMTTPWTITASNGSNGTISPSGATSVANGNTQQFTTSPDGGYVLDKINVDGTNTDSSSTYTFASVGKNHTINASFKSSTPSQVVGDSTVYGTNEGLAAGYIYTFRHIMTTKGAVQYIKFYTGVSNSANMKAGLFTHKSSTNLPDSLIAEATELTSVGDNSWKQFNFSSPPNVQRDTVWIGVKTSADWNVANEIHGEVGLKNPYMTHTYATSFPAVYASEGNNTTGRRYSRFLRVQP
jgi:hypothetical protein